MALRIFLELSDGIKGESQDKTYKDKIQIENWTWHVSNPASFERGQGGSSGVVNVNDISLTKFVDLSSKDLIKYLCAGNHMATGKLTVLKDTGADELLPYYVIDLKKVKVTSYSASAADSADKLMETFTLAFEQFLVTYTLQSETGGAGTSGSAGYNIATTEKLS
jgi:type VI secretion system secreted protein Hcp